MVQVLRIKKALEYIRVKVETRLRTNNVLFYDLKSLKFVR